MKERIPHCIKLTRKDVLPLLANHMIYDICPTNSFLPFPMEMVALTTSRIYFMIYLIDITDIDRVAIFLNFCAI